MKLQHPFTPYLTITQQYHNSPLPHFPTIEKHNVPQESLRQQCLTLLAKLDLLEKRLSQLERKAKEPAFSEKRRKKNRRKNGELSKRFKCLKEECPKVYDSVTSLKYHMRTKHEIRVKKKRLQDLIIEEGAEK